MTGNSLYLKVEVTLIASTVVVLAILTAATGFVLSNGSTTIGYRLCAGVALFSLFLSLFSGCYGLIKSLSLLGCEQWNIRMVSPFYIAQIILLCIGFLLYLISLIFIS